MRDKVFPLVLTGFFAVLFLGWGLRVLARGRATVANPNDPRSYPGMMGKILFTRNPDPTAPAGANVEVTGAEARNRAILYLVLGAAFAFLFVITLLG